MIQSILSGSSSALTQEESMNSANAAMVMEKLTQVVASEFSRVKEAKGNANACVVTYAVTLPCIVNTVAVKAGQEIVAMWHKAAIQKKTTTPDKQTAFDQLARAPKKPKK
eukprot:3434438-Pyramimonas_sp.AAC.1